MSAAIKGFVLAVIAAAFAALLVLIVNGILENPSTFEVDAWVNSLSLWVAFAMLLYFAAFAALALGLIGVPLTLVLAKRRREGRWTYPLSGLLTGSAVASGLYCSALDPYSGFEWDLYGLWLAMGGVAGFVAGIVWWKFYRKKMAIASTGNSR